MRTLLSLLLVLECFFLISTVLSCLPPSSLILLEDSSVSPIGNLQAGSVILGADEKGNFSRRIPPSVSQHVKHLLEREVDKLLHLTLQDPNDESEEVVLTLTPDHLAYSKEGGWTAAGSLVPGDWLLSVSGDDILIIGCHLEKLVANVTVLNIEVLHYHTYYVSELHILLHNFRTPWTMKDTTYLMEPKIVSYGFDNKGRPTYFEAEVKSTSMKGKTSRGQVMPFLYYGANKQLYDAVHRGHLVPGSMGMQAGIKRKDKNGVERILNVVPQNAKINSNQNGLNAWTKQENDASRYLARHSGESVTVTAEMSYTGDSRVPDEITRTFSFKKRNAYDSTVRVDNTNVHVDFAKHTEYLHGEPLQIAK